MNPFLIKRKCFWVVREEQKEASPRDVNKTSTERIVKAWYSMLKSAISEKSSFHWAETKRILPSFFFNSEVHWTENWLQGSSAASFNTHSSPHCIEKNYLSLFWDHLYKLSCLLGDHIAKNDIGDYCNNECLHAAPQVVFTSQRERLSLHKEDFGTYCSFALIITVEVATETQISSL